MNYSTLAIELHALTLQGRKVYRSKKQNRLLRLLFSIVAIK
jgi:hypothetical protein